MADSVDLNVTVGGTAGADMKALADALDAAAKAEEEYAEAVKKAADKKQDAAKFDKSVSQEMARREPGPTRKEQVEEAAKKQRDGQRFAAEVARANRTTGDRAASLAGGAQGLAGGGGAMGLLGKLGPWGLAAAAGFAALEAGLNKAADALNIANSGIHTQAQKQEMLAEKFVPLYGSIKKFGEALDGTTEALAAAKRNADKAIAMGGNRSAAYSEFRSFEHDKYQGNESTYRASLGKPDIRGTFQTFDRSSAIGQQAANEAGMVDPAKDAVGRAAQAARAAGFNADMQAGISRDADNRRDAAKKDADEAVAKLKALRKAEEDGGPRKKKEIGVAGEDARVKLDRFERADAQAKAELERSAAALAKTAEEEANWRRASVELSKAELAVLEQKEQRMAGFAQKLGAMSEADFEMAKASLEMVRETLAAGGTLADLPNEIVEQAAQVGGEFIGKEREKLGEKRAKDVGAGAGKGLDDSLIAAFQKETLAEVRAKVDKVRADVRVEIDLDAELTAKAIVDKISPILGAFGKALNVRVEMLEKKFDTDRILKANADG